VNQKKEMEERDKKNWTKVTPSVKIGGATEEEDKWESCWRKWIGGKKT